jgi:hypothetical protein
VIIGSLLLGLGSRLGNIGDGGRVHFSSPLDDHKRPLARLGELVVTGPLTALIPPGIFKQPDCILDRQ